MKAVIVAIFAILAITLLLVQPGQAVSCVQVDAQLIPCVSYLTGRGDSPSPACCSAVKTVKGMAQTTADRRALCSCLKAAANNYADLKDAAAQSLPTKCGVSMDVPISRTFKRIRSALFFASVIHQPDRFMLHVKLEDWYSQIPNTI